MCVVVDLTELSVEDELLCMVVEVAVVQAEIELVRYIRGHVAAHLECKRRGNCRIKVQRVCAVGLVVYRMRDD